ncbi:MAG: phosphotransferase [Marinosulfonomonas sp.]|nr:phosphotransferase [Marinosulfonomonas sp.]
MSDRKTLANRFLSQSGWGNASQAHLAGDASNRSYLRLTRNDTGETAVLMDAPPKTREDIQPFVAITTHLTGLNLSPPRILAQDKQHGFLLIEDLGDALFARLINDNPDMEQTLYRAAVDVLIQLHQHPAPDGLLEYTPTVMAEYIGPVFEWYHPATPDEATAIITEMESVLTEYCSAPPVMALRDYHAENLLWLPDRAGTKRVGLLDYQDAVITHPSYDLVSLLKDARRDVPAKIQTEMIDRYIVATRSEPQTFHTAYCANGAQRNLRILGIFARLCVVAGKPGYIDLIPRVWGHLKQDLSHPALANLNRLVFAALPEPTTDVLQRLKSKCTNPPTP